MRQVRSVLLVEDEPLVRRTLQAYLEEIGCTVQTADTGDAAYELLKRNDNFDLLLTDVRMPGTLNGFELIDRAVERRPTLRTIAMSGGVGPAVTATRACNRFMQKPFSVGKLEREIAELLPG